MSQITFDVKSTLIQVMDWYVRQQAFTWDYAVTIYMSPYCVVTVPQCIVKKEHVNDNAQFRHVDLLHQHIRDNNQ